MSELTAKKSAEAMRRDWDARARTDAFHYIASWRKDWDESSFFASGEDDYLSLVQPVLVQLAFDPRGKSMAELGCGAGRMTRAFASRFSSVSAVDISQEMQTRAKSYLGDFTNIRWVLTDGSSLSAIDSSSLDFVFSYIVLQHFPSKELVASAILEMMRILKPGAAFLFQFNGSQRPTMNFKGRVISSVLDALHSIGLHKLSASAARFSGIDPDMIGKTWRGVSLSSSEIDSYVRAGRAAPLGFTGVDTPLAWCFGRKSPEASA